MCMKPWLQPRYYRKQVWWYTRGTPALGKWRLENQKFRVILECIGSSRLAWKSIRVCIFLKKHPAN